MQRSAKQSSVLLCIDDVPIEMPQTQITLPIMSGIYPMYNIIVAIPYTLLEACKISLVQGI